VKFVNVLLFSIASAFLAGGVGVSFGWRRASLVALGLLVFPPTYQLVPTLLTEPLYVSLLMFSFGLLLLGDFSPRAFVLSGLLLGFATLVRPTSQFFPPMLVFIGIVLRGSPWSRRVIVHGAVALAVCLPTVGWNWWQFGKVGIANGVGAVAYLGSDLRRDGDEPMYSGVDFDTYRITSPYTHLDTDGDARLIQVFKERISKHPTQTALLFVRKAGRYLFGSYYGYFWPFNGLTGKIAHESSLLSKIGVMIWPAVQVVVVVAALVSLFWGSCSSILRMYVGAIAFYFTALHVIAFPIPRMFMPLYPYVLVLGVVGLGTREVGRKARALFGFSAPLIFAFVSAPRQAAFPTEVGEEYLSFFEDRCRGALQERHDIEEGDSGVIQGPDPYEVYRFDGISLLRSQVFTFALGVRCPLGSERRGIGQIFWSVDEQAFSESRSITFPMRSVDAVHVVRPALGPTWSGTLNAIRVDLPPEFVGCAVRVQEVQLLD
jgi:hypothetical protein